jgi:hypothetical protein
MLLVLCMVDGLLSQGKLLEHLGCELLNIGYIDSSLFSSIISCGFCLLVGYVCDFDTEEPAKSLRTIGSPY